MVLATGLSLRRNTGPMLPLFLLAGVSMALTRSLIGPGGLSAFQGAATALQGLIDSMPFPHENTAPLLKAFLTGDRSGLSPAVKTLFRQSGASHLLALSGLHIGILYLLLGKLTWVLGRSPAARRIRSGLTIAAAGVFTLMTGASPSIVRAFLFIVINEVLHLSGRPRDPVRVLCLALFLQLAVTPEAIRSVGFQLSYLAMAGIFLLYPSMEKWYPDSGRPDPLRSLWKTAALSISCQVFTAPLVWLRFHSFPVHFLITNLLAIPITTGLMGMAVLCLALGGAGCCPELLARATDALCTLLLRVLEIIASM
jgi:competence protein ComEC